MHLTSSPVFRPNSKSDDQNRSRKRFRICVGVLGAGGSFLVAIGAILLVYMPQVIEFVVRKERVLSEDSRTYAYWADPPLALMMKFRFFNITNYKEYVEDGVKPIVDEVGPYVYSQKWHKNKIQFHDNDTVSYVQNKTYFFEPLLSSGTENDIIFSLNVPMLAAAWLFKNAGPVLKIVLTTVFTISHESFVMNATVKELLWDGWDDPILKAFKTILPNARYPYSRFAYFYNRNGSDEGLFNIYTGANNPDKASNIYMYNGKRNVASWEENTPCNEVKGTPGETFPPGVDSNKPLTIFIPDLCRSFNLEYAKPVEHYGIKAMRFQATPKLLANGTVNPDNACYCPGKCLPSGALNISECKWGTPVAMSLAHFLYGDPRYANQVVGLKQNESIHNLYIDVEPKTGIVLDAHVRFQLNAILERIPGISHYEHVNNTVFPLLWLEQSAGMIPEIVDLIRLATIHASYYSGIASYVIMCLGALMILSSVIYYLRHRSSIQSLKVNQ